MDQALLAYLLWFVVPFNVETLCGCTLAFKRHSEDGVYSEVFIEASPHIQQRRLQIFDGYSIRRNAAQLLINLGGDSFLSSWVLQNVREQDGHNVRKVASCL